MKSRLLLAVTLIFTLGLNLFPVTSASAAEPDVWVLVETHFAPPEKHKEWEHPWGYLVASHKINVTDSEFTYTQKIIKAGTTTVEASFRFAFDKPPEELVPGDIVRLRLTGSSSGKGNVEIKSLSLSVQERLNDPVIRHTRGSKGKRHS